MISSSEALESIASRAVARSTARDVVLVAGPDAASFLQGQCTQDLSALSIGQSIESLLLSPQGKFEAYVRVICLEAELFGLATLPGFGASALERLRRFKLRVKADLSLETWTGFELRGPVLQAPECPTSRAGYVARIEWPGLCGYDVIGDISELDTALLASLQVGPDEAFEFARIEAGMPLPGFELDDKTIPEEAGLTARTVSFTKGCYTGQELVARLDARGNRVPRRLRAFHFPAESDVLPGAPVLLDGRDVGRITSSARLSSQPVIALGYLRRDLVPPCVVEVAGVTGEVTELPSFARP